MLADYTTFLVKSQLGRTSDRRAHKVMKTLDRTIVGVFDPNDRQVVERLLPGYKARRYGSRFGVTIGSVERSATQPTLAWTEAVTQLKRELRLKNNQQAINLIDSYIKAHVSLMSASSRLQFTHLCPDNLLRAYLRVTAS